MQRAGGSAGITSPFWGPPCQSTSQQPGVRVKRGAERAGQPWEEEEAVTPSRSLERWCYIYPPTGLGLSLSPVTQALQPARI